VWFLVAFPVIVLALFGWLVSQHPEKLYAPGDFRSDDNFLKRSIISQRHTAELLAEGEELKNTIRETVKKIVEDHSAPEEIADRILEDITQATTITVDAHRFTGNIDSLFIYPVAAFETFGDLLDDVYLRLYPMVRPYNYGSTWVLKNSETGEAVRSLRMILGAPAGQPLHDTRSLKEVGIQPGSALLVEKLVK
jgi:hypothetical protein